MKVVQFNRKETAFVDLLDVWWFRHSKVTLNRDLLSDYGFLYFDDNQRPVFAAFFYPLVGSNLCMWGFQIANPESSFDERTVAIEGLATAMCDFAKKLGYKTMAAYPGNKAIVKRLKDIGFVMGDEIVTQAYKEL